MTRQLKAIMATVLVPIILVTAWWVLSADSTSIFYPALSKIWDTFRHFWFGSRIGSDIVPSLARMFAGLALAIVLGISVGVVMGKVERVRVALNPTMQFLRCVPAVALVPVSMALLGLGDLPKVLLIAFVSLFPILLNSIDGVRGADPAMNQVALSYRLTSAQRIRFVTLPAAAPQIFAGVRVALGLSFIMMVVSEMVAATNGIGFQTLSAQQSIQVPQMWSGMLLLGILGAAVNQLFEIAERRVLHWHYQNEEHA